MKICGVYAIINNVNQKRYIGYSCDINRRKSLHYHHLRRNKHCNEHLQKSWNKYGIYNFTFVILQECARDKLAFYEDYWAKILKANDPEFGYNIRITNSIDIVMHSEDTKKKISEKMKGIKKHPFSLQHLENLKIARNKSKINSRCKKKAVIDILTNIVYDSIDKAALALNIKHCTLSRYLSGKSPNKTNLRYLKN